MGILFTKPPDGSWSWNNMIKLRIDFKSSVVYQLGRGNISFWFYPWVQNTALTDMFPGLCIFVTAIPRKVKVGEVWRRGHWLLPTPYDDSAERTWNLVKQHVLRKDVDDKITWKHTSDGRFKINSAWHLVRPKNHYVSWHKWFGGKGTFPGIALLFGYLFITDWQSNLDLNVGIWSWMILVFV